jgi:heterodisulfide reductase subunit A
MCIFLDKEKDYLIRNLSLANDRSVATAGGRRDMCTADCRLRRDPVNDPRAGRPDGLLISINIISATSAIAKRMISMSTQTPVGSVLVVGGGITGMQSALDLADAGYFVYLVEASPAIGGAMAQLDKTFPTNDCSM